MLPLINLFKFAGRASTGASTISSHSFLVETYRYYVRNSFLFMFALSSMRQVFGPNIVCHTAGYAISQEFVDTKCFINGTVTIDDQNVVHHHQYYQWIPLVFLLQALTFQIPFSAWIRWYGHWLQHLTSLPSRNDSSSLKPGSHTPLHISLVREIVDSRGRGLFTRTVVLELVYAVVTAVQAILINQFLNGELRFWKWRDSLDRLFPESGNCYFNYYSGGDLTEGKFICLLPLNALYAKLFFFVYLLFSAMVAGHVFVVLLRLKTCFVYSCRVNEHWVYSIFHRNLVTWHHGSETRDEFRRYTNMKIKKISEILRANKC